MAGGGRGEKTLQKEKGVQHRVIESVLLPPRPTTHPHKPPTPTSPPPPRAQRPPSHNTLLTPLCLFPRAHTRMPSALTPSHPHGHPLPTSPTLASMARGGFFYRAPQGPRSCSTEGVPWPLHSAPRAWAGSSPSRASTSSASMRDMLAQSARNTSWRSGR